MSDIFESRQCINEIQETNRKITELRQENKQRLKEFFKNYPLIGIIAFFILILPFSVMIFSGISFVWSIIGTYFFWAGINLLSNLKN